jgi:hypothetical protein
LTAHQPKTLEHLLSVAEVQKTSAPPNFAFEPVHLCHLHQFAASPNPIFNVLAKTLRTASYLKLKSKLKSFMPRLQHFSKAPAHYKNQS